jgi:rod shape-determining protein MreC
MDFLFSRYRNLTVLLVALFAQLVLLAYQVKTNHDGRLVRVWAVTAVTPLARLLEAVRSNTVRVVDGYFMLIGVNEENQKLKAELGQLKMENQYLKAELGTADRAQALAAFQSRMPSRTIAARIIGTGTGANSKVVFIDRGSSAGIKNGMAAIKPDGIVGKVVAAYPTAAQVLLINDPSFAAGVISEKNRLLGTLKGTGQPFCRVDYLQNEARVETGEWFYTSGDDRVFPRGLPVGQVTSTRTGKIFKEIKLLPSGLVGGLDEVLIVLEGVHQPLPEPKSSTGETYLLPPLPSDPASSDAGILASDGTVRTEADRLRERYRKIGEAQGHVFGEGLPGSKPPDFNLQLEEESREKPSTPDPQPAKPMSGEHPRSRGSIR